MNLMDLFIKIGVDDQATSKISKISASVGKGLASAAKIGVAAIGAASTAIIGLGKIGLDYNKQMETYTTNFEVMMGDAEAAAKKVEELKEMGAKTPFELGDLANATQTLLAFNVSADDSTGVLQKLGDISLGNAQKLETLTRAYGKMNSSQKVTLEDVNMLIDSGFNPLLLIAEDTGETMEELYDRISKGAVSFEEMEKAINTATSAGGQFYQGMAKASQTTEGLISTLKDNATALVGEVYKPISDGLVNTVLPAAIDAIGKLSEAFKKDGVEGMIAAAGDMLGGLVNSIVEYAPKVVDAAVILINSLVDGILENEDSLSSGAVSIVLSLVNGLTRFMPKLLSLGFTIIKSIVRGISSNIDVITDGAVSIIEQFFVGFLDLLPDVIELGLNLIVSLAEGIAESIPELIPSIIDVVLKIVEVLTNADTMSQLLDAALKIVVEIANGLVNAIPQLVGALMTLVTNIVTFLKDPENLLKVAEAALEIVIALGAAIVNSIPVFLESCVELIESLITTFKETDWKQVATDMIDTLLEGLKNAWESIKSWFSNAWDNLFGNKSVNVNANVTSGGEVDGSHAGGLSYVPYDGYIAELHRGERVLTASEAKNYNQSSISFGDIIINVNGAKYEDERRLAVAISEAIQSMIDRKAAVYA